MVLEEESRIIVETETVDTQTQPLLPVQPPDQQGIRPDLLHSRQSSSQHVIDGQQLVTMDGVPGVGIQHQSTESLDAGFNQDRKSMLLDEKSLLKDQNKSQQQQHFGSSAVAQASQQLVISHNPLSPHPSVAALRNKKSSLLIDSLPAASESILEDDPREHDGSAAAHGNSVNSVNGQPHNSGNHNDVEPASSTTTGVMGGDTLGIHTAGFIARGMEHHPSDKPMPIRLDEESRSTANFTTIEDSVDQESTRQSKEPSTKADFFAARLASAVGENEISDSEETFVYESTANSTKNSYEPISSTIGGGAGVNCVGTSITGGMAAGVPQQSLGKPYGIPVKLSTPMLNKNKKLLERLKTTRHSSIAVIPVGASDQASSVQAAAQAAQNVATAPQSEDLKSIHSSRQRGVQHPQAGQSDIQSVKSSVTNPLLTHSPGKRLSLMSLSKTMAEPRQSRNISTHSGMLRLTQNSTNGSTLKLKNTHLYPLRTTASRIFDANGASLRRYSGVPDDINLEDYVEQENGELTPNKFTYRSSSEMGSEEEDNGLDEEEGLSYVEEDEDDVQSMFYYHGNTHHNAHHLNANNTSAGNDLNNNSGHGNDKANISITNIGSHHGVNRKHKPHYGAIGKYTHSSQKVVGYEQTDQGIVGPNEDLEALYYFRNNNNNTNNNDNNNPGNNDSSNNSNGNHHSHGIKHFDFFFQPDELAPLKNKKRRAHSMYSNYYNPHNFYTKRSNWNKFKSFVFFTFVVTSLLALGFIAGFLLATNKELHDFQITHINNVLVSNDELVFDIKASSFNPSFFTVAVQDVDLDIFAKTAYLDDDDESALSEGHGSAYQTILLGTVYSLESPLRFQGGFFSRTYDSSVSTIKLLHPGITDRGSVSSPSSSDHAIGGHNLPSSTINSPHPVAMRDNWIESDADKWKSLIRYKFDLIIRGNMKYNVPFFKSEKSVVVQAQVDVSPNRADGTYMSSS